jgi:hypothetical protein
LKQRRKNNSHFCVFANCDFKFKQAFAPCRTAKFTSKNLLKFYLFDKIRVQSSTGTKFKHFINGKKRESVMFFSDFILGRNEQNKP